jgi:hypothetical protein
MKTQETNKPIEYSLEFMNESMDFLNRLIDEMERKLMKEFPMTRNESKEIVNRVILNRNPKRLK